MEVKVEEVMKLSASDKAAEYLAKCKGKKVNSNTMGGKELQKREIVPRKNEIQVKEESQKRHKFEMSGYGSSAGMQGPSDETTEERLFKFSPLSSKKFESNDISGSQTATL